MKKITSALILLLVLVLLLGSCITPEYSTPEIYEITSSQSTYTYGVGESVDLKTLFTLTETVSGKKLDITDDMIEAPDACFDKAGMFTATCKFGSAVKSVIIIIKENPPEPAEVSITGIDVTIKEGDGVNVKNLFTLKENGNRLSVTEEMLSLGGLNTESAKAGVYTVTLTYTSADGVAHSGSIKVTVEEKSSTPTPEPEPEKVNVSITSTNKTVEEGTAIDVKSLFTVKADGIAVSITDSMLNLGGLNASNPAVGTYTVKLTYISTDGATHTKTAAVTVKAKEITPDPTPAPEHAGTKSDPYTVADAIAVLDGLITDADGYAVTELVYVKGIVVDAGTPSSNGNYFKNVRVADCSGSTVTLKIYSANPKTASDKDFAVGDTVLLEGYLRITQNTGKEMGSKGSEYTYFSVLNGTGGGSQSGNKMPTQVYNPSAHEKYDSILADAQKDYIENDPYSSDMLLATGLPSQGAYNALVIPVQFKNDTFTSGELSDLERAFNGTASETGWESVRSYYLKSSFGKLDITFDIYSSCVTMPNNYSYYETEYGDTDILAYALSAIDAYTDLSRYDTDGDGYIDAVYLVYSAPVEYESENSIYWAFVNWEFESERYDGVYAHTFFFGGADFMYEDIDGTDYGYEGLKINASTYIHETGHLLGLDDYYDYNEGEGSDNGLGNADMMDYTVGDHNVYSKLMLGWVTPTVITSTQTVTLRSSAESGEFVMILLDYNGTYFSEYLLIDLYTATGLNGMHADVEGSYLYDGEPYGARIYHVSSEIDRPFNDDYCSFTTNNNSMSSIPLIKLIEADGDSNYESDIYGGNRFASYDDLWQTGDVLSLIMPNYTRHDGKLLNFDISFDSVSAGGVTLTVTFD